MNTEARLLSGILANAASIIEKTSRTLPGTLEHGMAPDHLFENIESMATGILRLIATRTARQRRISHHYADDPAALIDD